MRNKQKQDWHLNNPHLWADEYLGLELYERHVVEGGTFNFGYQRAGTMVGLEGLGIRFGFQTHVVPICKVSQKGARGVNLSSTMI